MMLIERVLVNLPENATKYTPAGTAFTFTLPMEVPPPLETEDAPDISAR